MKRRAVAHPIHPGPEAVILCHPGSLEHLPAEALPLPFVLDREQHQLTVAGSEGSVGCDGGMAQAHPLRSLPAVDGVEVRHAHPIGHGREERHLESRSPAGALPEQKGLQDGAVGVHASADVADRDPHLRRSVWLS